MIYHYGKTFKVRKFLPNKSPRSIFNNGVISNKHISLIFPFQQDRDDTETADAAGEESEKNVGGGDEPEGEDINHRVAVMLSPSKLLACLWPVYSVHPHTSCIENII